MGTNISADPQWPGAFELSAARLTDPRVSVLVAEVQSEYVIRYGGVDQTPMDVTEFDPPAGMFVLGCAGGLPVACGEWRRHEARTAEIKRMYVTPPARRRGLAAAVLAELERTAVEAGVHTMILETGTVQPEALALYASCGYRPVPRFGYYQDAPQAVHLGKDLGETGRSES